MSSFREFTQLADCFFRPKGQLRMDEASAGILTRLVLHGLYGRRRELAEALPLLEKVESLPGPGEEARRLCDEEWAREEMVVFLMDLAGEIRRKKAEGREKWDGRLYELTLMGINEMYLWLCGGPLAAYRHNLRTIIGAMVEAMALPDKGLALPGPGGKRAGPAGFGKGPGLAASRGGGGPPGVRNGYGRSCRRKKAARRGGDEKNALHGAKTGSRICEIAGKACPKVK